MADAGLKQGQVKGTGRDGRILKQDVLNALATGFESAPLKGGAVQGM